MNADGRNTARVGPLDESIRLLSFNLANAPDPELLHSIFRSPPLGGIDALWELRNLMDGLNDAILKNLSTFIAFARKRVGDPHLAEDLVQESLIKALKADRQPARESNPTAWFYRILRHTIIDLHRRRAARSRTLGQWERQLPETPGPQETRLLCACFKRLIPSLPSAYQDLLTRIDLEGTDPALVAQELGVTRNNLTVRLHRARRHLRDALAKNCRACSRHGCLDCTCE